MRNNNCLDCLNMGEGIPAENTGWYHPCKLGLPNEDLQDLSLCHRFEPNMGFQMGGYYTHTHFEGFPNSGCIELIIHGDLEFPKTDQIEWIRVHICDFTQIEDWVAFWGKELRRRGWIEQTAPAGGEEGK